MICFMYRRCSSSQGTCTIYNNKQLAINIGSLILGLNVLVIICIALAYTFENRRMAKMEAKSNAVENQGCTRESTDDIHTKI